MIIIYPKLEMFISQKWLSEHHYNLSLLEKPSLENKTNPVSRQIRILLWLVTK